MSHVPTSPDKFNATLLAGKQDWSYLRCTYVQKSNDELYFDIKIVVP